jgi:hypothetical protein
LKDLPATIAGLSERLTALNADMDTAKAHEHDRIAIGKYSGADMLAILGKHLDTFPQRL